MRDFDYDPVEVVLPAGGSVRFVNVGEDAHTVTSQEHGKFDSGQVPPGGRYELPDGLLGEPGRYPLWCVNHAGRNAPGAPFTGMVGAIIVEAPPDPAAPGSSGAAESGGLLIAAIVGIAGAAAIRRRA